jgi:hypothetical protein
MSMMSTGLGREGRGSGIDTGNSDALDILWGTASIARFIGLSARQTHYLLSRGAIRAARQIGTRWCASRQGLREQFCGGSDQEARG